MAPPSGRRSPKTEVGTRRAGARARAARRPPPWRLAARYRSAPAHRRPPPSPPRRDRWSPVPGRGREPEGSWAPKTSRGPGRRLERAHPEAAWETRQRGAPRAATVAPGARSAQTGAARWAARPARWPGARAPPDRDEPYRAAWGAARPVVARRR